MILTKEQKERIKKIKNQFKDGDISETQMYDNIYTLYSIKSKVLKMIKEIKMQTIAECDGCKFSKVHITDGNGNILRLSDKPYDKPSLEFCTKYKDRPKRDGYGFPQRLPQCVNEFTLFEMPEGYKDL